MGGRIEGTKFIPQVQIIKEKCDRIRRRIKIETSWKPTLDGSSGKKHKSQCSSPD